MRRMRRMRRNSCAGSRSLPFASVAVVFFSFLFFFFVRVFFFFSRIETRAQPFPIQKWSNPIGRPECVPETVEHFRCYERFSRAVGFCFFIVRPIFIFLFFYQSEENCFRFCPKCVPEIMERSLFYFPLNQFLSCFRIDLLSQSGKKKLIKNQIIILITFISMNVPETMERSSTFPMLETDSTVFFNQFLSCFRIDLLSQTD